MKHDHAALPGVLDPAAVPHGAQSATTRASEETQPPLLPEFDNCALYVLGGLIRACEKGRYEVALKYCRIVSPALRHTDYESLLLAITDAARLRIEADGFTEHLIALFRDDTAHTRLLARVIEHAVTDVTLPEYGQRLLDMYCEREKAHIQQDVRERLLAGVPVDFDHVARQLAELDALGTETEEKGFIPLRALFDADLPSVQFVAAPLLVKGGLNLLAAPPKCGKSFLLLDFAHCYLTGRPWLGRYEVPTATDAVRRVFWLTHPSESSPAIFRDRCRVLGIQPDLHIHYLEPAMIGRDSITLNEPQCFAEARDLLRDATPDDVLVLDSLTRFFDWQEQDAGEVAKGMALLRSLCKATVLVIHHTRKPTQSDFDQFALIRGSSDLFASVDCAVVLKKKDCGVVEVHVASRVADEVPPFTIERRVDLEGRVSFIATEDDEERRAEAFVFALLRDRGWMSRPDIVKAAGDEGIPERTVTRALGALFHRGEVDKKQRGRTMFYTLRGGESK